MKFKIIFVIALILGSEAIAQAQNPKYSIYYYRRASLFEQLPGSKDDIIFLGNSITDGAEWAELLNNPNIKNRGISGDITQGILDRLDPIVNGHPAKLFLMIGINDISKDIPIDTILNNISKIINEFQENSPETKIYLQSLLPVNDKFSNYKKHVVHWESIPEINEKLRLLADSNEVAFIDLFPSFVDESGYKLNENYTNDGLHLTGPGYIVWANVIRKYVNE